MKSSSVAHPPPKNVRVFSDFNFLISYGKYNQPLLDEGWNVLEGVDYLTTIYFNFLVK